MLRLLGAALVTLSASLVGFGFARGVRRQCAQLEGLLWALDFMQSELSSRLTPLPPTVFRAVRLPAKRRGPVF